MATRQLTHPVATPAATVRRAAVHKPSAPRNRVLALLATVVDVIREARELEIRMLGQGGYRRLGES